MLIPLPGELPDVPPEGILELEVPHGDPQDVPPRAVHGHILPIGLLPQPGHGNMHMHMLWVHWEGPMLQWQNRGVGAASSGGAAVHRSWA